MRVLLDAQLPPGIARWIGSTFGLECEHVRDTSLAGKDDHVIFAALRAPGNIIVSKDEDFADLVTRLNAPPQILWVRLGNLTNRALREAFSKALPEALELLRRGEPLVEIGRNAGR